MIAFTEVQESWEREYLQARSGGSPQTFFEPPAQDCAQKLSAAEVLSVFIKSKVDRELMDGMPALKFIATRSTGFDHIDLAEAAKRGITVSNVPTYGENTVAEHTFALILSLSRNLRKAYLRTVRNDFALEGLMGFDLKGKTLGVVGTGHIGLHVIRMGVGFGMNVLAHDMREQTFLSEVLNFRYTSLEELLAKSDIISLHVPYMPATHHLIDAQKIGRMKKGAMLINTSRGGLIDTGALVKALDDGNVGGAGLDVLEEEEYILEEKRLLGAPKDNAHWGKMTTVLKNHVLLHRENVIYTPHMAFYSREAVERILEVTVQNIRSYFAGKPANTVHERAKTA